MEPPLTLKDVVDGLLVAAEYTLNMLELGQQDQIVELELRGMIERLHALKLVTGYQED